MSQLISTIVLAVLLLVGCGAADPAPTPTGPAIGGIPVFAGAEAVSDLPMTLRAVEQSHGISLDDLQRGGFRTAAAPAEVLNSYAEAMAGLRWRFVDQIDPAGDLIIRRYLREGRRAIIAVAREGDATYLLLLDGRQ